MPLQGRQHGALRRPAGELEPRHAQARLWGGVALAALVGLAGFAGFVGLVGSGGTSARPARPTAWVGPSSAGSWVPSTLTVQTNALVAEPGHPDLVVAATDDGVWRSGDGGIHWARVGTGLRSREVDALAATPGNGSLFAGAADGAVYALDAGRAGWRRLGARLSPNPIYSLAVAADGHRTVLAGTVGGLLPRYCDWRLALEPRCPDGRLGRLLHHVALRRCRPKCGRWRLRPRAADPCHGRRRPDLARCGRGLALGVADPGPARAPRRSFAQATADPDHHGWWGLGA